MARKAPLSGLLIEVAGFCTYPDVVGEFITSPETKQKSLVYRGSDSLKRGARRLYLNSPTTSIPKVPLRRYPKSSTRNTRAKIKRALRKVNTTRLIHPNQVAKADG